MIITIVIALISILALVVLHELGHFILAKKFGVRVDEFGVGYPPRLFGKKFGETIYSINLIPFGAFVRIYGEEEETNDPRGFGAKALWQRALIILGGVISFWVVAVILLSFVMALGVPSIIDDSQASGFSNARVQILAVAPGSPAESSGIKVGDSIIKIKTSDLVEKEIVKVSDAQGIIDQNKGKELTLVIQRGGQTVGVRLVPRVSPPNGQGPAGIALVRTGLKYYPWYQAPIEGLKATYNLTLTIIEGWVGLVAHLIERQPTGAQLVGPVGIVSLFAQVSQLGVNYYLQFIAVISVNLALINLLPLPVADGGKLLLLFVEKIRGRAINKKIEKNVDFVVFALLIILMIWVTINDVTRLFG